VADRGSTFRFDGFGDELEDELDQAQPELQEAVSEGADKVRQWAGSRDGGEWESGDSGGDWGDSGDDQEAIWAQDGAGGSGFETSFKFDGIVGDQRDTVYRGALEEALNDRNRLLEQHNDMWSPKYSMVGSGQGGGGEGYSLQSRDRNGWGNYQFRPLDMELIEGWGDLNKRLDDINDELSETLDLDAASDAEGIADNQAKQDEMFQKRQRLSYERNQLDQQRQMMEDEIATLWADTGNWTPAQKPLYEPWYMPKDPLRPIRGF
jgi:hypothetical protein